MIIKIVIDVLEKFGLTSNIKDQFKDRKKKSNQLS